MAGSDGENPPNGTAYRHRLQHTFGQNLDEWVSWKYSHWCINPAERGYPLFPQASGGPSSSSNDTPQQRIVNPGLFPLMFPQNRPSSRACGKKIDQWQYLTI